MKKIYQNPKTEIIRVETQQMIAESEFIKTGGSYNGSSAIESRDYDDWDE